MPGESESRVRTRVVYSGRVQGVGFRYTTLELSRGFAVVGYVRNLPDRTVELEAEGASAQVESFLAAIARNFSGHIRDQQRSDLSPRNSEPDFEIGV